MTVKEGAWRVVLLLSLAGLALGAYLTAVSLVSASLAFCEPHPFLSCDAVIGSPYGHVAGVPVALVGALGYGALFVVAYGALLREAERRGPWTGAAALLALAGMAFGTYLTVLELFVIGALCPLCFASFVLVLPVAVLTLDHVRRNTFK